MSKNYFEDMAKELFFLHDYSNDIYDFLEEARANNNVLGVERYEKAMLKTFVRIQTTEKIAEKIMGLDLDELRKRATELFNEREKSLNV